MLSQPPPSAGLAPAVAAAAALAGAPAAAHARETRTMQLTLHADPDVAFPLFGPVRETEWSPDWAPRFVFPPVPAQGPEGAVFTTGGGDSASVWVMTDYDPRARQVRYAIFHPGRSVGELSIHVAPAGVGESTAEVTYRFTALTAEGDAQIARWVEHFPHMAPHWEHALNARLARLESGR